MQQLKEGKIVEIATPEIKNDGDEKAPDRKPFAFSSTGETYALKVINKAVLHPEAIDVIRGESKILKSLVGLPNLV